MTPGSRRRWATALALLSAAAPASRALAAQCELQKFAEFPITMEGMRPLMTARIEDTDVQFVVDSGAFYSLMSEASAAQLKLKRSPAPFGFSLGGVHGAADVSVATAKTFMLSGATLHNVQFLVGGSEVGGGIGLLGQNFLHIGDVEYDLGGGTIRLMQPKDCRKSFLGYWIGPSKAYSVIDLERDTGNSKLPHTLGVAYVNGTRIRVMFDTGAAGSVLSLKAAARAGIRPESPGVVKAGMSYGIGKSLFANYIAPVASFKVGGEEIQNTRMRIGDIELPDADMLLGADFFLSHRIYVANSQQKIYFTYNGGPVFNLSPGNHPPSAAAADASAPAPESSAAAPESASDFARRGAAFASRQRFDEALTALTHATELAPEDPEYAYLRGRVYLQLKQPDAAKADFDRALALKSDDLPVLVARAELAIDRGDKAAAATDLDAADAVAPKQADIRFEMANVYERAGRLPTAIAQLTLWLDSHSDDARMPMALDIRCRFRAIANTDLPLALKDCNAALRRTEKSNPSYQRTIDSRGLVFLRMYDYDKAIADYDASLKVMPRDAQALYGRGIAELRKHETPAGNADLAGAVAVRPQIADDFKRWDLAP